MTMIFTRTAWALVPQDPSADPGQYGINLLKEGKISSAVEAFIRALLADPNNTSAQAQLTDLGTDRKLLSPQQRLQLTRFLDLISYLNFTDKSIHQLRTKNAEIMQFIQDNDPKSRILPEAGRIGFAREMELPGSHMTNYMSFLQDADLKTNFKLDIINERLQTAKDEDVGYLKELQELHTRLWALKQQILVNAAAQKQAQMASKFTHQIEDLNNELSSKNRQLQQQQQTMNDLSNQLGDIHAKFADLQSRFLKAEYKTKTAQQGLAGATLEVYEKDRLLADQISQAKMLENQLIDAGERLTLVQRIMNEKDNLAKSLEDKLNGIQLEGSTDKIALNIGTAAGPDIHAPADREADSADQMTALEAEIRALHRQYQNTVQDLRHKNDVISELQGSISSQNITIAELQSAFISKDLKITELSGVIDIYKYKLAETFRTLAETKKILNDLEKKMQYLEITTDDYNRDTGSRREPKQAEEITAADTVLPLTQHEIFIRAKSDIIRLIDAQKL